MQQAIYQGYRPDTLGPRDKLVKTERRPETPTCRGGHFECQHCAKDLRILRTGSRNETCPLPFYNKATTDKIYHNRSRFALIIHRHNKAHDRNHTRQHPAWMITQGLRYRLSIGADQCTRYVQLYLGCVSSCPALLCTYPGPLPPRRSDRGPFCAAK